MRALVSLSGGMDSTTVLAKAIEDCGKENVRAIRFKYGSKHNRYENAAAVKICQHYGLPYPDLIDFSEATRLIQSNLLLSGGQIPEGHYQQDNMSQTVVPGRNLIFISVLSGIAWSDQRSHIYIGAHQGDHVIYPDCRIEFLEAMSQAVRLGTDGNVDIAAPFLHGDKTTILDWGFKNGVPYHLTRTCYKSQSISCGKCGACQERLEAFHNHGVEDPIEYESREILPKSEVTQ